MITSLTVPRGRGAVFISLVWLCIAAVSGAAADTAAQSSASPAAAASAQQKKSPQQKLRTFAIWEYQLKGNTLLSDTVIEKAVYPYLGPGKTIRDVQKAADSLERAYRKAGYPAIYVNIPQQNVVAGLVTLTVTEGRVGRVMVRGARYFTPSGIRAQLPALQPGKPLAADKVRKEIMALNRRSGDLRVVPVLKPGRKQGLVDVDLRVKDTLPLHGGIEYNNFNSIDTTRPRVRFTLNYNNLWQAANSFGLNYQYAPEKPSELNVISASYALPLGADWRLSAYAVSSKTDVKTQVNASVGGNTLTVLGKGKVAGLRFIRTLAPRQNYSQVAILGVDYKDFNQQVAQAEQPIRYVQWSAQYNATALGASSLTSFTLATDFGIRGLVNNEAKFAAKRADAHAGYVYFTGIFQRTDTLPHDWQLLSRAHVQITNDALIDNEQFSIGGFSSVRGYYESQTLGDYGYSAGLELHTPSAAPWFGDYLDDLRALAFYDVGEVHIKDALPEQATHINLESVGAGLQLQAFDHVRALWNIAYPLKSDYPISRGDWRSYVRVDIDF